MIHKVGKHTRQGNTWLKYYKLNKVNSYHTGGTDLTKWELNGNRKTKYGHTQGKLGQGEHETEKHNTR